MTEKIISDGNIVLVLTSEEYEIFKSGCVELLNFYELSKNKINKIKSILDKLTEANK